MSTTTVPTVHPGDAPRARATDPLTSHAAADLTEDKVAASQRAVLAVLSEAMMPLTEEIAGYLKREFSPSRVRTARHELEEDGLVMCAGTVKPPGKRAACRTWVAKADAA